MGSTSKPAISRTAGISQSPFRLLCFIGLLPLDCCRRFAGYIIDDAVDAADLVDDSAGDKAEHFVGDLREVGGHKVQRLDGADGDYALEGPRIAHNADGLHRDEHRQGLGDFSVQSCGLYFVDDYFVGGAEDFEPFGRNLADDSHRQAGPWKRVPPDDVLRQAEVFAYASHLVFEQVAQRLDKLEAELLGQAADVVVQLDVCRRVAVFRAGLDDVGIERALGEEFCVGDF